MKKKFKDMTNEELDQYCERQRSNSHCRWCPLLDNQTCLKFILQKFNEEADVDENNKIMSKMWNRDPLH